MMDQDAVILHHKIDTLTEHVNKVTAPKSNAFLDFFKQHGISLLIAASSVVSAYYGAKASRPGNTSADTDSTVSNALALTDKVASALLATRS